MSKTELQWTVRELRSWLEQESEQNGTTTRDWANRWHMTHANFEEFLRGRRSISLRAAHAMSRDTGIPMGRLAAINLSAAQLGIHRLQRGKGRTVMVRADDRYNKRDFRQDGIVIRCDKPIRLTPGYAVQMVRTGLNMASWDDFVLDFEWLGQSEVLGFAVPSKQALFIKLLHFGRDYAMIASKSRIGLLRLAHADKLAWDVRRHIGRPRKSD